MKTDNQLYSDIMEKLEFEPMIDPSKITVAIHEGIVTLGGTVTAMLKNVLLSELSIVCMALKQLQMN